MTKPMLRLVREEDRPAAPVTDADEEARIEAEYRQALLMLDVSDYERAHGPNAYTAYVRRHGKRPPPAEARAMALVMGKRVKADDGRFYPKKTKAEREFERIRRDAIKAKDAELNRSLWLRRAIDILAEIDADPNDVALFSLDEKAIDRNIEKAFEWLGRFAESRMRHVAKPGVVDQDNYHAGNRG